MYALAVHTDTRNAKMPFQQPTVFTHSKQTAYSPKYRELTHYTFIHINRNDWSFRITYAVAVQMYVDTDIDIDGTAVLSFASSLD